MYAAEAALLLALTLGLVLWRPLGLNEGVSALIGAGGVVVLGLAPPRTVLRLIANDWNIFLFFLGMMVIAAAADQSGVMDAVAVGTARLARGSTRSLFVAVFGLGAAVSLLFANDTAALVLTPIVYAVVVRLKLDPLPFVFATTFVADTASIALPVSNPLNVILFDAFDLTLGAYVQRLWLPALLALLVNLFIFMLVFRRALRGRFDSGALERQSGHVPAAPYAILAALTVAYLLASALQFPLGPVAVAGAVVLLVYLWWSGSLDMRALRREISWPIFGFIAGMVVLVGAIEQAGLTGRLGAALVSMAGASPLRSIALTTMGAAVGSNIINNLPMALVMTSGIQAAGVSPHTPDLVYAAIIGCDLGPNLTHLGSLATFLWLFYLRRQGLEVSARSYLRLGLITTPPMLLAAILGLWLTR